MSSELSKLATNIKNQAQLLGFADAAITDTKLEAYHGDLLAWLEKKYHGDMAYMDKQKHLRLDPKKLLPGTERVIVLRMNYLPQEANITKLINHPSKAYIARYALGRDYHKVMRKKCRTLAQHTIALASDFGYRAFVDSAPIMEKPLAEKAGLGWIGKNTLLLNAKAGSWFFLGTLLTDLKLPIDPPQAKKHCGSCRACIDVCPTQAIVAPYQLDARRCISYLTIEYKGSIPLELRSLMGNRIFGCDDCQICCPWNKFAKHSSETDFSPRHPFSAPELLDLFTLSEQAFLRLTEGSAIRRAGFECWQRNIAVALGNAAYELTIQNTLKDRYPHSTPLVQEHIQWAIEQQHHKSQHPSHP
jgi:epoxyqueuosine reductase